MKKKLKFYLSHSFETRHEVRKIEHELEKEFGIELYNPFYDSVERQEILKVDNGEQCEEILYSLSLDQCAEIVNRDLSMIDKYGAVLVYIVGSVGLGTALEIGYAITTRHMLIIVTDKYYNHPWARYYAHFLFKDISELKAFLNEYGNHPVKLRLSKWRKDLCCIACSVKYGFKQFCLRMSGFYSRLRRVIRKSDRVKHTIASLKKTEDDKIDDIMKSFRGR